MSDILTEMVEQYQELFANRGLQLQHTIQPVELRASPHLVHIMLSNLLSNQQKYTSARGRANVTLEDKKIEFKNQGQPLRFAEDKLFTRFKKEKASSESIGLGLAIIKQICHVHKWDIVYAYADGWHVFTIYFGR
jgi:signal transduction histidine kinase